MQSPDRPQSSAISSSERVPYLSIVLAVPWPQESADSPACLQLFLNSWIEQARRYGLYSEVILAGHNPGTLRCPIDNTLCEIRIVDVPREHQLPCLAADHRRLTNAGIRRARGEFILATYPGIILSDELVAFIASRRLKHGRMYRANCYDVEPGMPLDAAPAQCLAYCRAHLTHVSAREGIFEITPEGLRRNAPDDIASIDSGVSFGGNWFAPERYAVTGETFRWIENDAEIAARVPEGGGILMLEVEPGPGLSALPQPLQVFDDHGDLAAEWTLNGRTTTALAIPPGETGSFRKFRIHLPGGGAPVLDDLRILNLAVFRCGWVDPNAPHSTAQSLTASMRENSSILKRLLGSLRKFRPWMLPVNGPRLAARAARLLARRGHDIFEAGMDFQLGPGWYYREESAGGERFRWVSKDACMLARMPRNTSTLALIVEPGPVRSVVMIVRSTDEHGPVLLRAVLQGLTYIEFEVPAAPGTIAPLCFTVETPGSPIGPDARTLSFRVFAIGAGKRSAASSANAGVWHTLSIDSKPVTKDWTSRREASPQLGEMGHPAYLHTNTCTDFTLMARAHWFDLRGYSELDLPPGQLDALFCYAAHHAGAQEEIFEHPLEVYRAAPTGKLSAGSAVDTSGVSPQWRSALHDDLLWLVAHMRSFHCPVIFNRQNWGLDGQDPDESSPAPSGNPSAPRA